MTEHSITETLLRSLRQVLPRFVKKLNETETGTGTDDPRLRELATRVRFESECV
jgi:hypothetical protein